MSYIATSLMQKKSRVEVDALILDQGLLIQAARQEQGLPDPAPSALEADAPGSAQAQVLPQAVPPALAASGATPLGNGDAPPAFNRPEDGVAQAATPVMPPLDTQQTEAALRAHEAATQHDFDDASAPSLLGGASDNGADVLCLTSVTAQNVPSSPRRMAPLTGHPPLGR